MMKSVQAADTEAKLFSLLDAVEQGETIDIVRDGRTIARLVPVDEQYDRRKKAVERIIDRKKTLPKTSITVEEILSARDEGRR